MLPLRDGVRISGGRFPLVPSRPMNPADSFHAFEGTEGNFLAAFINNTDETYVVHIDFADGRSLDATQDRTGVTGGEYHLSGAPTD